MKHVFQHENGKYLSSYQHEDGGNCELTHVLDDATMFPETFSAEALREMLEGSDDYDPGDVEWDYTKFKSVPVNINLK